MGNPSSAHLEPARGLPASLVIVVCIITVTEALSGNVIWPFLPSAVQRWGATEEQTGIYVGLLASAFFLAQVLFVVHWGRAADRFGRRPALLIGLAGTIICTLLFGVADSFALALLSRFLIGALNGNVALTKVYVGECADKKTIAKAFSYLSFSWGIGVISAPALGGLLADPAEQFPDTFGGSPFWKRFPYLLPNLIPACWAAFALLVGYWGLPETAVWQRRHRPAATVAEAIGPGATASSSSGAAGRSRRASEMSVSVELAQLQGDGPQRTAVSVAGDELDDDSPLAEPAAVNVLAATSSSAGPAGAERPRLRSSSSSHGAGLTRSRSSASQGHSATAAAGGLSRSKSSASTASSAAHRASQVGSDAGDSEVQGAGASPVPTGLMRALSMSGEGEAVGLGEGIDDAIGIASEISVASTASGGSDGAAFAAVRGSGKGAHRDQTDAGDSDRASLTRSDAAASMTVGRLSAQSSDALSLAEQPSEPAVPEGASLKEVFADHAIRTSILAYGLLAVAQVQFDELVPVLLRLDRGLGGLGFSARETGLVQVVAGGAQIFGQLVILAPVTAKYGPIRCFLGTMLPLVALVLFPVVALFGDSPAGTWALLALFLVSKTLLMQIAFTSIMIVINNSTRGFNLGLVTGLAQAVASGVRAIGPTVGGGVFSASLQWRGLGPLRMHAAFISVAFCLVAGFWMGKRIPLWADSPPDYAAETTATTAATPAAAATTTTTATDAALSSRIAHSREADDASGPEPESIQPKVARPSRTGSGGRTGAVRKGPGAAAATAAAPQSVTEEV